MGHLGINESNYFKYLMGRYKRAPRGDLVSGSSLKLRQLLYLDQG